MFFQKAKKTAGAASNKILRAMISALVAAQRKIAPNGYRQPLGLARSLDIDQLHEIIMSAEGRNVLPLFTVMRDMIAGGGHVTAVYSQRKLSVLADGWKIEPADRKNEKAVWIAEQIKTEMEEKGAMFNMAFAHLLGGSLWPAAVVQKVYKRSQREGWIYELAELPIISPVAFDYATDPAGKLRLNQAAEDGTILTGQSVYPMPDSYIVHRATVLTEVPEYFGGQLRAVLFWFLFASFGRSWWVRFLNRFGSPFIKGTYDSNNPDSQYELELSLQAAQELFGLVIPEGTTAELVQAQTAQGGDAFAAFHAVANAEISKIILGQSLSADAQNIGFGGGQATVQNEVRGEIKAFDALMLAHTIKQHYFMQLCRYNDWPTELCPSLSFGAVSNEDINALAELLEKLGMAGLQATDDALEELSIRVGFGIERKPIPEAGGMGGLPFSANGGKTPAEVSPMSGEGVAVTTPERGSPPVAAPAPGTTRQLAEQAALANNQIVADAVKPLAAALGSQGQAILDLLGKCKSRGEFLDGLAKMPVVVNPDAIDLLADAMSAAGANGVLAAQPKIAR